MCNIVTENIFFMQMIHSKISKYLVLSAVLVFSLNMAFAQYQILQQEQQWAKESGLVFLDDFIHVYDAEVLLIGQNKNHWHATILNEEWEEQNFWQQKLELGECLLHVNWKGEELEVLSAFYQKQEVRLELKTIDIRTGVLKNQLPIDRYVAASFNFNNQLGQVRLAWSEARFWWEAKHQLPRDLSPYRLLKDENGHLKGVYRVDYHDEARKIIGYIFDNGLPQPFQLGIDPGFVLEDVVVNSQGRIFALFGNEEGKMNFLRLDLTDRQKRILSLSPGNAERSHYQLQLQRNGEVYATCVASNEDDMPGLLILQAAKDFLSIDKVQFFPRVIDMAYPFEYHLMAIDSNLILQIAHFSLQGAGLPNSPALAQPGQWKKRKFRQDFISYQAVLLEEGTDSHNMLRVFKPEKPLPLKFLAWKPSSDQGLVMQVENDLLLLDPKRELKIPLPNPYFLQSQILHKNGQLFLPLGHPSKSRSGLFSVYRLKE